MKPLRILIIEDNLALAQVLKEQLLEFGYSVTDCVSNGEDAIAAFQKRVPDIVLVGIILEHSKLDGIQIVQRLNKIQSVPVIYLTAYFDDMTKKRARETNPAYYLVKPCNQMQLEIAIEFSISNFTQKKEAIIDHSLRFNTLPDTGMYPTTEYFFTKAMSNRFVRVNMADLLYIHADNSSVEIITQNNKLILSANLSSFCRQFPHPSLLRVHRSYVVNLDKVTAIEDNCFIFQDKAIPIGKSYKEKVARAIIRLQAD